VSANDSKLHISEDKPFLLPRQLLLSSSNSFCTAHDTDDGSTYTTRGSIKHSSARKPHSYNIANRYQARDLLLSPPRQECQILNRRPCSWTQLHLPRKIDACKQAVVQGDLPLPALAQRICVGSLQVPTPFEWLCPLHRSQQEGQEFQISRLLSRTWSPRLSGLVTTLCVTSRPTGSMSNAYCSSPKICLTSLDNSNWKSTFGLHRRFMSIHLKSHAHSSTLRLSSETIARLSGKSIRVTAQI